MTGLHSLSAPKKRGSTAFGRRAESGPVRKSMADHAKQNAAPPVAPGNFVREFAVAPEAN